MAGKKRHPVYNERAIGVLRDVVAALRQRGIKSPAALRQAALYLGATRRRVFTLFYRDREFFVSRDEWNRLCTRAATALRTEAGWHRDLADRLERKADALDASQQQSLLGDANAWGNEYGPRSEAKRIAWPNAA